MESNLPTYFTACTSPLNLLRLPPLLTLWSFVIWRIQYEVGFTCCGPFRYDYFFPHEWFFCFCVSQYYFALELAICHDTRLTNILKSCNLRILRQTTVISLVFRLSFQQHSDLFFHRRLGVMSLRYLCFVTRGIYFLVNPPLHSLTSTTHLVYFQLRISGFAILERCVEAVEIDSTRLFGLALFLLFIFLQLHPFFQLPPSEDVVP